MRKRVRRRWTASLGSWALAGWALTGWSGPAQALDVRVLITSGPAVTVAVLPVDPAVAAASLSAAPASSALSPAPLAPAAPVPLRQSWQVGVAGGNLTLDGRGTGSPALYLPPAPGSRVELGGQTYRGGVLLRVQNQGVQAINVVDIEDYLRGVVAAEMPASWPAAALAAQAVIARTYVAARINPAKSYDTCATEQCQVYRGVRGEHPATDAAVAKTAGQVLAYGGQPAQTYFSSDSGGYVASSDEVWNTPLPYLVAQPDPYSVSAGGPGAKWSAEVPLSRVGQLAAGYGVRVGTLSGVEVTRKSASGRAQQLTFRGSGGSRTLEGAEAGGFLRSLGAKSSRVSLSRRGTALQVTGAGNGHGVGLSQYGALGMARAGYDHLRMLGFYYPGTTLDLLAGPPGAVGQVDRHSPSALALAPAGKVQP
ncbi:SpoIID/LytB domain-containing protein [Deinococcus sp. PESE-13]